MPAVQCVYMSLVSKKIVSITREVPVFKGGAFDPGGGKSPNKKQQAGIASFNMNV